MDSMIYTKVGFNTFTPNKVNIVLNVHQYIPNPPLEFQEGDILGVYQPTEISSGMELYYQTFDGPSNYKSEDKINTANIQTLPVCYEYPLVTVEISTDAIPTTLVTTIPTSTSHSSSTKSLQAPLKSPSMSNSSNSHQVVLPIFAYPVISVAAILIIIAAVITVVVMITCCFRKNVNRNSPRPVNMQIDQNLSYAVNPHQ